MDDLVLPRKKEDSADVVNGAGSGSDVKKPPRFEKPVAWLLGREFASSIKRTLLYIAFGSKLDPRDWMQAEVDTTFYDEWKRAGEKDDAALWFDYVADTGDGMRATYSIAYLCMSDLRADAGGEVGGPTLARDDVKGELVDLPRGSFLFIGGDTAYHLADYMTLAKRFQDPFEWAFDRLKAMPGSGFDPEPRPLYGIPGNHDYYDQLDGFRRQFRQPAVNAEEDGLRKDYKPGDMQLVIPGFRREQESSYLALRLAHDWWLWGLDTEVGQLDERQRAFFRGLCAQGLPDSDTLKPPDKLIIATSAPTTVFGKLADANDEKAADAFAQLGVAQPFLPDKKSDGKTPDFDNSGDAKLDDGQCRLDLAGDVHHYARYWGPREEGAHAARREEGEGVPAPAADSYASVMSGLGGAFHHPSTTFAGEIREQVLYPTEERSREEVAGSVFKFWNVMTGGSVHIIGFVIAFVVYFAIAIPQSSRQELNNFWLLEQLRVAQPQPITPTVSPLPATFDPRENPEAFEQIGAATPDPAKYQEALQNVSVHNALTESAKSADAPTGETFAPPCSVDHPRYLKLQPGFPILNFLYDPCRTMYPLKAFVGALFLWLSLAVIGFGLYQRDKIFGSTLKPAEKKPGDSKRRIVMSSKFTAELNANPAPWLWVLVPAAIIFGFGGLYLLKPFRAHITPFGSSMIVLFTIIWAVTAAALAVRHSEHLHIKSFGGDVAKWRWWLSEKILPVLAVVSVAWGLWSFGTNNLPSLLVSDIVFIVVVAASAAGIIGLGWAVAGDQKGPGAKNRLWFVLLGLWHAVLQLFLPFMLIRRGTWLTLVVAAVLTVLPAWFVGEPLMRIKSPKARRFSLVAVWLLYGGLMLSLPYWTTPPVINASQPFMSPYWSGWAGLLPALIAGGVGAVLCCLWFGWYLGIALTFHGHNNEVGGAARIENFKEFVRIKLTRDRLTAYVIAIDEPQEDGSLLTPKLVDVFTLRPKGNAPTR